MEDQPTLFELEVLTKYVKDGVECNSCGITQPVENYGRYHAEIKTNHGQLECHTDRS